MFRPVLNQQRTRFVPYHCENVCLVVLGHNITEVIKWNKPVWNNWKRRRLQSSSTACTAVSRRLQEVSLSLFSRITLYSFVFCCRNSSKFLWWTDTNRTVSCCIYCWSHSFLEKWKNVNTIERNMSVKILSHQGDDNWTETFHYSST